MVAATADMASTNRPWTTSFISSAELVRSPKVRAASETFSRVGITRTENSLTTSTRILLRVMSELSPARLSSSGTVFIFTSVIS